MLITGWTWLKSPDCAICYSDILAGQMKGGRSDPIALLDFLVKTNGVERGHDSGMLPILSL